MNRVLRKFRKYLSMQNREKIWVVLLFFLSALARAVILTVPFRRITPYLGQHHQNAQMAVIVTDKQLHTARWIGRITEQTARNTPWQSKCLVQAIIAKCLLSYYNIPYVLHLGVAKSTADNRTQHSAENDLIAHAWVSVGPSIITGKDGHRAFTIVSTFIPPSILIPKVDNRHSPL